MLFIWPPSAKNKKKQNIVKGLHHYFVLIHSIFFCHPLIICLAYCWLMSLGIQLPLITKEKQTPKRSKTFCTYSRLQAENRRIRLNGSDNELFDVRTRLVSQPGPIFLLWCDSQRISDGMYIQPVSLISSLDFLRFIETNCQRWMTIKEV